MKINLEHEEAENGGGALALLTGLTQRQRTLIIPLETT